MYIEITDVTLDHAEAIKRLSPEYVHIHQGIADLFYVAFPLGDSSKMSITFMQRNNVRIIKVYNYVGGRGYVPVELTENDFQNIRIE